MPGTRIGSRDRERRDRTPPDGPHCQPDPSRRRNRPLRPRGRPTIGPMNTIRRPVSAAEAVCAATSDRHGWTTSSRTETAPRESFARTSTTHGPVPTAWSSPGSIAWLPPGSIAWLSPACRATGPSRSRPRRIRGGPSSRGVCGASWLCTIPGTDPDPGSVMPGRDHPRPDPASVRDVLSSIRGVDSSTPVDRSAHPAVVAVAADQRRDPFPFVPVRSRKPNSRMHFRPRIARRAPAQRLPQPRPACAAVPRGGRGERRGGQAAVGAGDAVDPPAAGAWGDRQGRQDPLLPDDDGGPPPGERLAGRPPGRRRAIAQGRMREGVGESAHCAKKSNVSRTDGHGFKTFLIRAHPCNPWLESRGIEAVFLGLRGFKTAFPRGRGGLATSRAICCRPSPGRHPGCGSAGASAFPPCGRSYSLRARPSSVIVRAIGARSAARSRHASAASAMTLSRSGPGKFRPAGAAPDDATRRSAPAPRAADLWLETARSEAT